MPLGCAQRSAAGLLAGAAGALVPRLPNRPPRSGRREAAHDGGPDAAGTGGAAVGRRVATASTVLASTARLHARWREPHAVLQLLVQLHEGRRHRHPPCDDGGGVHAIPCAHPAAPREPQPGRAEQQRPLLLGLVVSVGSEDEAPPQLGTNESYQLTVGAAGLATLTAQTIYGALRGLETFSQVVGFDFESSVYRVTGVPLTISDAPRFPHRGFMVDTSRHYQPLGMLKRLLDSMAYAKLNTLHWHAVDDQSFPLTVAAFPRLQGLGAYSAQERYTRLDVRRCPSAHSLAHQPRIPCSALLIACRALIDRSLTSSNTLDCEAFACCSRWIPHLTPAAGAAATQRSAHPAHARTGRHGRHSTHPSTPPST